jgi:riboflavin synthase
MFSGIIMNVGEIVAYNKSESILSIKSSIKKINLGDSISCSGVCLTISRIENNIIDFNISSETKNKTNLVYLNVGDSINLEKSLKVGDEINGHFVFGHVDGLSKILSIKHLEDSKVIEFIAEENIIKYLSPKCSVALDGISLTVNNVSEAKFNVSIIPYTWENTSLKKMKEGDFLNTEVDMLARYVFKALKK